MFRFTIRDLLWLMMMVALAVGWWQDRREVEGRLQKANDNLATELEMMHKANKELHELIATLIRDKSIMEKWLTEEQKRAFKIEKEITEQILSGHIPGQP